MVIGIVDRVLLSGPENDLPNLGLGKRFSQCCGVGTGKGGYFSCPQTFRTYTCSKVLRHLRAL